MGVAAGRASRWKVVRVVLLLATLVLVADQGLLRFGLADGYFLGRRIAPFDPPIFSVQQRAAFEQLRALVEEGQGETIHDAELGWAPPKGRAWTEGVFDWSGARVGTRELPRERQPGMRRVVAVGCSFTYGAEVRGEEAWPAVLDVLDVLRPDDELANLGMGAYGLDQALLRYLRDGRPLAADEVWLGFVPNTAMRVLSVHRPVLRHWGAMIQFKPRLVLDEAGELVAVPNPRRRPNARSTSSRTRPTTTRPSRRSTPSCSGIRRPTRRGARAGSITRGSACSA